MSRSLESFIAWRYLFSKKGHNAINVVSGVSAVAIAVVTACMICVLSVMNGFGVLVEQMFSEFDPPLLVTSSTSHTFRTDNEPIQSLFHTDAIGVISKQVEHTALIRYKDHQVPCRVIGVDSLFTHTAHIDSVITDGFYSVYDGAFERAVLGRGLAAQIGINAHFTGALHLYAPKRVGKINMLRPDQSLVHEHAFIAGTFAINQVDYDDQLTLVSLPLSQRLFGFDEHTVTALRIQPAVGHSIEDTKQKIQSILGDGYKVLDRYEQQQDFFKILHIEKLLTLLLLIFILLIASFNIIGSLSMLILDKNESIHILSHLGANQSTIRRIFLCEGWLISALGAVVGIIIGVLLCLGQQYFGWIKLGDGSNYVISAYPVMVQASDVLLVTAIVGALGLIAAWFPTHSIKISSANKICMLLVAAIAITSCTPHYSGDKKGGLPSEYTIAYQEIHGACYDSIPYPVVSLDLYSEGLELDQNHRMQGTGYNLYISDIFLPLQEDTNTLRILPGTYHSDTTALPFSFLPGKDWEGTPSGIYLLRVDNSALQSIQVIDSGTIVVRDTSNNLLDLQFTLYYKNQYGYKATYTTHFQGDLIPWQK